MNKLRVLDLFSGIGGFSLGLERTGGFETAAFCEIEEFPRRVLRKHWPDVPIFEDVRKLRGEDVGSVDVICGGYPCQPFSLAGQRRGAEDDRHLWPEFDRLVDELRPAWVIGENVAGHIVMGLDQVLSDLEGKGYACRPFAIPACAVDAPHRRDRVWIVANRQGDGREQGNTDAGRSGAGTSPRQEPGFGDGGSPMANASSRRRGKPGTGQDQLTRRAEIERGSEDVADTPCQLQHGRREPGARGGLQFADGGEALADPHCDNVQGFQSGSTDPQERAGPIERPAGSCHAGTGKFWEPEPGVGRVANGVPQRVDRLKALGNAVVPQIPEMIGHAILHAEASQ